MLTYGSGSKPCTPVVHIKIAGKWMFIPLKMVLIGIDPYPCSKEIGILVGYDAHQSINHPPANSRRIFGQIQSTHSSWSLTHCFPTLQAPSLLRPLSSRRKKVLSLDLLM